MPPRSQIDAPESDLARNQGLKVRGSVFVIGSPRSGTTLLYHMLFAVYRSESKIFDLLAPRFGNPPLITNRQRMLDFWLQTIYVP